MGETNQKNHCSYWLLLLAIFITSNKSLENEAIDVNATSPYFNGVFPKSIAKWDVEEVFTNLNFDSPIWMKKIPDQNKYLMVGNKGKVWVFDVDESTDVQTEVLDLTNQAFLDSDAGLYDLAFHPEYGVQGSSNKDFVYLYYNYRPKDLVSENNYSFYRISRFSFNENRTELSDETVLIQHFDRDYWHNGGSMFFDKHGFLVFSVGDEGGADDQFNNGQDTDERLFGGIFRIDVDQDLTRSHEIRRYPLVSPDLPSDWPANINQGYSIPDDNPWVSESENTLEEYYAIGLRSPHAMYYDPIAEEIWVGEVGQNTKEEINLIRKGENGQWPFMEGLSEGPKAKPATILGVEKKPEFEYGRLDGQSITGGRVFNNTLFDAINGKYLFADFVSNGLWTYDRNEKKASYLCKTTESATFFHGVASFCEGVSGEVYMVQYRSDDGRGKVLKLVEADEDPVILPTLLSETGVFQNLLEVQPASGFIPYTLNSVLWSDGAVKDRWIAIPNDGIFDSEEEKIRINNDIEWEYPSGTVFVKHFEMNTDARVPKKTKKLETRFFVINNEEGHYGVTYRWNEEGTDATLLEESEQTTLDMMDLKGNSYSQIWSFPSRSQCMTCHNNNSRGALGLKTSNMNKVHKYSTAEENQLIAWSNAGIFDTPITETDQLSKLSSLDDESAVLEDRVRSYIETNCSFCHRPGGVETRFDGRFSTPIGDQNIIDVNITSRNSIHEKIVKFSDHSESELFRRVSINSEERMPPIGRTVVHDEFVDLLREWIDQLEVPVTIEVVEQNKSYKILSNPSPTVFKIDFSDAKMTRKIQVVSLSGRSLFETTISPDERTVSFGDTWQNGIYVMKISYGKKVEIVKLIKTYQ